MISYHAGCHIIMESVNGYSMERSHSLAPRLHQSNPLVSCFGPFLVTLQIFPNHMYSSLLKSAIERVSTRSACSAFYIPTAHDINKFLLLLSLSSSHFIILPSFVASANLEITTCISNSKPFTIDFKRMARTLIPEGMLPVSFF